ncbi:hypothetical protein Agub_g14189 [Astrephomene gubernaculifera]|uniref:Uncharacterized protein n=1 Tax=Astrephomene gubernaculifera TaxID=47775 RepID=A0AAD3E3M6_9CHLO|nr:hypothetical protein Agub_g14189 [Astrephomene gubernaculifera]
MHHPYPHYPHASHPPCSAPSPAQVAQGGGSGEYLPMLLRVPHFGLPAGLGAYSLLGFGDVIMPGLLVAYTRRLDLDLGLDLGLGLGGGLGSSLQGGGGGSGGPCGRLLGLLLGCLCCGCSGRGGGSGNGGVGGGSSSLVVGLPGYGGGGGGSQVTARGRLVPYLARSYFPYTILSYGAGLCLTYAALAFSWFGDQGQPALLYLVPCTLLTVLGLAAARGQLGLLWRGGTHGSPGSAGRLVTDHESDPGDGSTGGGVAVSAVARGAGGYVGVASTGAGAVGADEGGNGGDVEAGGNGAVAVGFRSGRGGMPYSKLPSQPQLS